MAACDELLEAFHVLDLDVPGGDIHQALVAQVRDAPADGLQAEPEVGAHFFAAHFQDEVPGGITTRVQTLRQVKQEGGKALIRVHIAHQHEHGVIPDNFPAQ